jgi:hypothetical protein
VKTWERDQIDSKLPEVRIQLTREAKAACNTTHGSRDEVVQITNCKRNKIKVNNSTSTRLYANNRRLQQICETYTESTHFKPHDTVQATSYRDTFSCLFVNKVNRILRKHIRVASIKSLSVSVQCATKSQRQICTASISRIDNDANVVTESIQQASLKSKLNNYSERNEHNGLDNKTTGR